jgi:hypothetical protein
MWVSLSTGECNQFRPRHIPLITEARLEKTRQHRILMLKWLRSLGFQSDEERDFVMGNLDMPEEPFESWEEIKLFRMWAGKLIYRHNGVLDNLTVSDWRQFCRKRNRVAEGEDLLSILPNKMLKRLASVA